MSGMHVCVIVGPAFAADRELVEDIIAEECASLTLAGRLLVAADTAGLGDALRDLSRDDTCAVVLVPGTEAVTRELLSGGGDHHTTQVVWFDPAVTGPIDGLATYVNGRGLWGLSWAIRRAVHRRRYPVRRVRYGPHGDQWGELRLPRVARAEGWPIAMLLHGGYWRSVWGADLMDAIAVDLAGRGFAVWNLEYRRPDRHGWAATTDDVANGLAVLHDIAQCDAVGDGEWHSDVEGEGAAVRDSDVEGEGAAVRDSDVEGEGTGVREMSAGPDGGAAAGWLDLNRVAVIGHSAGGQLALRLAADAGPARVAVAVSLAGVIDLAAGAARGLSNGAVAAALGGSMAARPDLYDAADPMARLPIAVPMLIVQGRQDDLDLIDINRRFVRAARAAADDVVHLELAGDHFAVIDPESDLWRATMADLVDRLRPASTASESARSGDMVANHAPGNHCDC
jgi:acetyl esterase/lipase